MTYAACDQPSYALAHGGCATGHRLLVMALLILGLVEPISVRAQTPISPSAKIAVDNAGQVKQLARLGRGTNERLAWSPDGKTIAVGGSLGVWLYATENLQVEPRLLEGHTSPVTSVAFSPDGKLLASAGGYEDMTVRLWDVQTGQSRAVLSVVFSLDGKLLATASADGTARLWGVR